MSKQKIKNQLFKYNEEKEKLQFHVGLVDRVLCKNCSVGHSWIQMRTTEWSRENLLGHINIYMTRGTIQCTS